MAYVLVPVLSKDVCSIIRKFELINHKKEHKEKQQQLHKELQQNTDKLRYILNYEANKGGPLAYGRGWHDNGYCKEEKIWNIKRRFATVHEEAIQKHKKFMVLSQ